MDAERLRQLALGLPEAIESVQQGRIDFLVGSKVFATLFPDEGWGVIKLDAKKQPQLVRGFPTVFQVCEGSWGKNGATIVQLKDANDDAVFQALSSAWFKHAPLSARDEFESQ